MRTQPIPRAYRTFFRQIGLDPDIDPDPERGGRGRAAAARRLCARRPGRRRAAGGADRDRRAGLGARRRRRRSRRPRDPDDASGDRLGSGPERRASLSGAGSWSPTAATSTRRCSGARARPRAGPRTRRVLFAVGVAGVPPIHIEEALWVCVEVLEPVRDRSEDAKLASGPRRRRESMALLSSSDRLRGRAPSGPASRPGQRDELAARRSLRAQIARLERELAGAFVTAFRWAARAAADRVVRPRRGCSTSASSSRSATSSPARSTPRGRRSRSAPISRPQTAVLLERMLLEPGRYRFARISCRELGEPGCGVWQVRPRLGLIGMLMGWWQVKLSSGCPLATGPRLAPRPEPRPSAESGYPRRRCDSC